MPSRTPLPSVCVDALNERLEPELFQALCDPVRLSLLAHLAASGRALTVTEASQCCGIHFSGVSRHLALLKRAGVVRAEKHGREVHYVLEADALTSALRGLADALDECWDAGKRANAS